MRAVRAVAPPERLVVDDGRAGRQQLVVVAAILHLVDVTQRDPLDRDAGLGQEADLPKRAGPGLAVRVDGHAGPPVGRRRRAEDRHVAIGGAVLAAGDLDDPGPNRRPVDDRARVVARVDAHLDIRHEQVRQLVLRRAQAPMRRAVELLVVKARGSHEVDVAPPRQLREHLRVAPAIGRHGVDRGPQAGFRGVAQLRAHAIHVRQEEVRRDLDRLPADDDEVLVGVGHAHVRRLDVPEDGPHERHGPGSGETDTTDQPPSTLSSCPVTARDSSDRK